MAVQLPNFLQAPVQKPDYSGITDALKNILTGYQYGKMPEKMAQESEGRNLLNQKARLEVDPKAKAAFVKSLQQELGGAEGMKNPLVRKALGLPVETTEEKTEAQVKTKRALQLDEELPTAEKWIDKLEKAVEISKKNPQFYGPGVGGFDFLGGPGKRKRNIPADKQDEYGTLESILTDLTAQKATNYSHRGLATAFKLAEGGKASFADLPGSAVGKLTQMLKELKEGHAQEKRFYDSLRSSRRESVGDKIKDKETIQLPSNIKTQKQFRDYLKTLTPKEVAELRKKYVEVK